MLSFNCSKKKQSTESEETQMRLWHKDLIPVLPRQQLLAQWRECCCIVKNIADNGTPNHLLVNKMMKYTVNHFTSYTDLVLKEMKKRGYDVNPFSVSKFYENLITAQWSFLPSLDNLSIMYSDIYYEWHTNQYLKQCYYNLQEKYDCGCITDEEWEKIQRRMLEVKW